MGVLQFSSIFLVVLGFSRVCYRLGFLRFVAFVRVVLEFLKRFEGVSRTLGRPFFKQK